MDKESTETDFGKANSKYIGIAFSFSLGLGFHGSSLFFLDLPYENMKTEMPAELNEQVVLWNHKSRRDRFSMDGE